MTHTSATKIKVNRWVTLLDTFSGVMPYRGQQRRFAMTNLPQHGQVIVFDRLPAGSYCRPGEAYRVDRPTIRGKVSKDFRFVSIATGSSSYSRPALVAEAAWHAAA